MITTDDVIKRLSLVSCLYKLRRATFSYEAVTDYDNLYPIYSVFNKRGVLVQFLLFEKNADLSIIVLDYVSYQLGLYRLSFNRHIFIGHPLYLYS